MKGYENYVRKAEDQKERVIQLAHRVGWTITDNN
ncbi:MAG: hypothetical protein KatS3mg085_192 [Candidatus Dojkabacteria bacterium]|nr:MAG: hypothetical protein KatS3mg085_192 [Candidatus Dojkabacteria bacterium]